MGEPDDDDDGDLTDEQQSAVAQLTPTEVAAIDAALLAETGRGWRKVAMVVAMVMSSNEPSHRRGIPDVYYAARVRELVRRGVLESAGNLRRMRYSEVRRRTSDKALEARNPSATPMVDSGVVAYLRSDASGAVRLVFDDVRGQPGASWSTDCFFTETRVPLDREGQPWPSEELARLIGENLLLRLAVKASKPSK